MVDIKDKIENDTIGWNFPGNNFGQIIGISEAGIETFKGAPIASLAREVCQNSLDAVQDRNKPVYMEFEAYNKPCNQIEGYEDLKDALHGCYDYGKEQKNEKTISFFEKALNSIEDNINILRISDYNTNGLTGSDKAYDSNPWQNLVKSNGVSDKGGSSGGSYGIGKAAPFACSSIRTVFYRTLDKDGLRAVQGVSKLISFRKQSVSHLEEMTTGTGYYGSMERNTPIGELDFLDNINLRNKIGTDLFVIGFNEGNSWQEPIILELLEGFMLSFFKGLLEVKVGKLLINKDSLKEIIEKYQEKLRFTKNYFRVMTEDANEFREEFEGMGILYLRVLIDEGMNRNVLMSRNNGMKLFDKNRISKNIQFSGVLQLEGEEINSYFRRMESPQHNAWEPERYEEKKAEAKKKVTLLYKWIKDKVNEFCKCEDGDELDADGVGELIPDLLDGNNSSNDKEESISDNIKDWEVKISKKTSIRHSGTSESGSYEEEEELEFGDLDEEGKYDSRNIPNGSRNNTNDGQGAPAIASDGNGNRPLLNYKEVKNSRMRMFVSDSRKGQYTLVVKTDKDISKCCIEIKISGEQSNFKANISEAYKENDQNKKLHYDENRIFVENIYKNTKNRIVFQLREEELYSLEVKLYEN